MVGRIKRYVHTFTAVYCRQSPVTTLAVKDQRLYSRDITKLVCATRWEYSGVVAEIVSFVVGIPAEVCDVISVDMTE